MPNSTLPPANEKAHEIARKIANERPLRKEPNAPDAYVTGGFNQISGREGPRNPAVAGTGWPTSTQG